MKWIDRLNKCIEYMEDHLEDEIETRKLCEIACLSPKYFFGLFEAACGISCANYIKNRRMTKAVTKLKKGMKVIDAAFLYGYASSESFSRAFKEFHGLSPSGVLHSTAAFISYPKLVFQIKLIGADSMMYRVEDKKAFVIAGRSIIAQNGEGNNTDTSALWHSAMRDGTTERLAKLDPNHKVYGACFAVNEIDQSFRYAVAAILDNPAQPVPDDLETYPVKAAKWAIFPENGKVPDVLCSLWNKILSEWIPSHEYEIDHSRPDIENYLDDGVEVWLPII